VTLLVAVADRPLLESLESPDLTRREEADVRRRLREEVTLLWRTDVCRQRPLLLDEVRTALAYFDASIFTATPRLCALDAALRPPGRSGRSPGGGGRRSDRDATPAVPAILRMGELGRRHRDGNLTVTADVTRATRGCTRTTSCADTRRWWRDSRARSPPGSTGAASGLDRGPAPRSMQRRSGHGARPERRFPDEPYRQRLGAIGERLARTRAYLTERAGSVTGRYEGPDQLIEELDELAVALVRAGLDRVAWGELQDLRWQVETFGFHLASLEVRQHAEVHAAALRELSSAGGDPARLSVALATEVAPGVTVAEVLSTFGRQG
jgi:phosphoenolpyruvate carboxylase